MKLISGHNAISLLALPNGFLFAYCLDKTEDQMKIGYKMVSFETGKISNVSKSIYTLSKFGSVYKSFEMQVKNYLTCSTVLLEGGRVFVVEKDGSASLLGSDAATLWNGKLLYQNTAPYEVAASDDFLWASFPEHNVLIRYNLNSLREELRIGGSSSPFSRPQGIFPSGSKLFVCNADSKDIWKIDTTDYAAEKYYEFAEPVHDYISINKYEIVSLDSGIYLL